MIGVSVASMPLIVCTFVYGAALPLHVVLSVVVYACDTALAAILGAVTDPGASSFVPTPPAGIADVSIVIEVLVPLEYVTVIVALPVS